MNGTVSIDTYTFAVLLVSVMVLGIFVGIVSTPFMATRQRGYQPKGAAVDPPDVLPFGDSNVISTNERYWAKRKPEDAE
jgi:hypothetical protein